MSARPRIPAVVLTFLALDLTFAAAYLLDILAGHPLWQVRRLLDLDGEDSLPTWYSSIQWFCAAVLMGAFVRQEVRAGVSQNVAPRLLAPRLARVLGRRGRPDSRKPGRDGQ